MQTRDEFLSENLNGLLKRLAPPMSIKADAEAQRQEIAGMMRAVSHAAPTKGYIEWWGTFEDTLRASMKTRAWPTPNEIQSAARSLAPKSAASAGTTVEGHIEDAAIQRMTSWFDNFKTQLPGHGRASRTAALVARGVILNLREARFRGFDLSHEQMQVAINQPASIEESRHHDGILFDLRAVSERLAEARHDVIARRAATIPDDSGLQ